MLDGYSKTLLILVAHRRWTFYVLLIWTGALLVSIVLFVPETYHPVLVLLQGTAKWGTDMFLGC
jgi:hypothetical protein